MEDVRVEHGRSQSGRRRRKLSFWIVGVLLFLTAVVGLAVILALHFVSFRKDQYGIVFDAGSSHTDMSIFRWPGDKIEETGDVIEVTKCEVEGPGISSYSADPDKAGVSIEKCMLDAQRKIPEDRKPATSIHMGATAGMRLLHEQDEAASDAVIEAIEKRFHESGFLYEKGNVQIINGVQEGISAWISANLLLGHLGQDGSKEETAGTLDMGGASTQISFETSDKAEEDEADDHQDLRLYGFDFPVFAHTYLCFGMNEAAMRFKSELALDDSAHAGADIINPCFNLGYSETVSATQLFNTTCTATAPENAKDTYRFIGNGDANLCKEKVREFLNATRCQKLGYKECFVAKAVPTVPGDKKFLAISGYYHTAAFFNGVNATPDDFKEQIDNYCKKEWQEVKQRQGIKEEFLSRNCFVGHYVHLILTEMYKFDTPEKWKLVEFSKKIAGVTSGWTLGYMTNATNALPVEAVRAIHPQVFISLLIVFLVLLLIIAIVGYRAYARTRSRSSTLN